MGGSGEGKIQFFCANTRLQTLVLPPTELLQGEGLVCVRGYATINAKVYTIEGPGGKKGRKRRFLTDLCFSWFKMDPACPSYRC